MSKAIRQYISSTYTARQLSQEEESQIKAQEIHEIENSDSEISNKVITLLKNNGICIVQNFLLIEQTDEKISLLRQFVREEIKK